MARAGKDPLSINSEQLDALPDYPRSFRPLGPDSNLQYVLKGRGYAAWALSPRRKSQLRGARSGPKGDGALSQFSDIPPPAIRKWSPWEL